MHWIIGDIHGMVRPLERLLAEISRLDSAPIFCFTGDYINRGLESRQVIELLLPLVGRNARFIRGNHDDIFDLLLSSQSYCDNAAHNDRMIAFCWFMEHGLFRTLLSYGVGEEEMVWTLRLRQMRLLDDMLAQIPQTHRDFFHALPPLLEGPGFFIAHGRWDPRDSLDDPPMPQRLQHFLPTRQNVLWGRFDLAEITAEKNWSRIGYFGHTPVENYPALLPTGRLRPIRGPGMVLLDTAVALRPYGLLTAWCHELGGYIQVDRAGEVAHRALGESATTAAYP